jgi:hypothetical protein
MADIAVGVRRWFCCARAAEIAIVSLAPLSRLKATRGAKIPTPGRAPAAVAAVQVVRPGASGVVRADLSLRASFQ